MNAPQGAPAAAPQVLHPAPIPPWSVQVVASMVLAALSIRMVMALGRRRYPEVALELPFAAVLGVAAFTPGVAGSFFTHLPCMGGV